MYNSPFKNKDIDNINRVEPGNTANAVMNQKAGDPPKNNKSSNIVKRMSQLDELISKGESGELNPQEAGKWREGQYLKEKRSLDLQLKSDYPDTWKTLHQKDGTTVVGSSFGKTQLGGPRYSQVTAKQLAHGTGRTEDDVLKTFQEQAIKVSKSKKKKK